MSELKTLNDLKESIGFSPRGEVCKKEGIANELYHYANIPELRQEAIKDIKELKRVDCKARKMIGGNSTWSYSEEGRNAIINYISWKFNITKED